MKIILLDALAGFSLAFAISFLAIGVVHLFDRLGGWK